MDKESTYGLTLEQLAELLSIGIDEVNFLDELSDNEVIAGLLQDRLISSLPRDASLLDSFLVIIAKMGYGLQSLSGKSLGGILLDPETDIGLLQAIKTYGKKLSFTVDGKNENAVALTIYHAAIASALVHHKEKISRSSYDKLDQSFGILIEKEWMTGELKEIFSQARSICQAKRGDK